MSAAYRVIFQNWTKAQAIDELINGGYGYHQNFYPGIIQLIENLDVVSFREKLGIKNEHGADKANSANTKKPNG